MDIQKEMQRFLDQEAVTKVMLKFGRSLDLGDWAAYRSCFTDVVNIDFLRLTGQEEVRVSADLWTRFAEQILSPVRRHHVYTNWDITVDGDRAYAIVYMTARHWKATDLGSSEYNQYGWYDLWCERQNDEWLISRIKHDFQWVSGNNAMFDTHEPELVKTMGLVFSDENKAAAKLALSAL
jgi:SnoaL-like domain